MELGIRGRSVDVVIAATIYHVPRNIFSGADVSGGASNIVPCDFQTSNFRRTERSLKGSQEEYLVNEKLPLTHFFQKIKIKIVIDFTLK